MTYEESAHYSHLFWLGCPFVSPLRLSSLHLLLVVLGQLVCEALMVTYDGTNPLNGTNFSYYKRRSAVFINKPCCDLLG